ncbi:MAG: MarR family EPS-associated transcriptional regulator [Flavobacteriaceae bacterium]|mgnify:CR=1 FL=1|nr:MarR family EPS-associated transcriptional regulator [Flavobacteriaceae bacterium]|tara:strand:- start:1305 stop:1616 length:312 start_codon:yes stop_codon:yes gene_type:complete
MNSNKSISEESLDLMHILEKNPNKTQRQLSKEIGSSIGKVNYCLRGLIDIGFIKVENFNNSNHKLKYAYVLTPKGIKQKIILSRQFIAKKIKEHDKLKKYIDQ